MPSLTTLLSASVIGLAAVIGAFIFGHHEGYLSGQVAVARLRDAIDKASAQASERATEAQKEADAEALAAAQAAVAAANAAAASRTANLQSAEAALARLKTTVNHYAKNSPEARWLRERIPPDIVNGMCLYTGSPPTPTRACAGGALPVHPGG